MKKIRKFLCCVLALCALLPAAAFAETQAEFEAACTARTTDVCSVHNGSKDGYVVAVIPAGTYVKVQETDGASWVKIQFYYRNMKMSGWAKVGVETVEAAAAPTVAPASVSAPQTDAGTEAPPPISEAQSPADETPAAAEPPAGASSQRITPDAIVTLGLAESVVRIGSEVKTVATADLNLGGDNVPADKTIAVVYAPKTGKATLREKASKSGKAVRQCPAGTVVVVLSLGDEFCRINAQGDEGYILASCLEYHTPASETLGTAVLSLKGAVDGKSKINVRNAADRDSAKVAEWKTGFEVTVFSHKGSWYEIEAEGVHGWVQEAYVTMTSVR